MLGVSRNHLRQEMKLYGIDRSFTTISDDDLDSIIRDYKQRKPKTGLRYIRGYLSDLGLRIPKERVRMSLQRVDPLGQTLRRREVIQRRTYEVPRPNYLWHIDGHHKMIRWGFVIHGITDGYCRTVSGWICGVLHHSDSVWEIVGMRVHTNNLSSTVLVLFLEAVDQYGVPLHMRGDRGRENVCVSTWMIRRHGANRAAFIFGRSVAVIPPVFKCHISL